MRFILKNEKVNDDYIHVFYYVFWLISQWQILLGFLLIIYSITFAIIQMVKTTPLIEKSDEKSTFFIAFLG